MSRITDDTVIRARAGEKEAIDSLITNWLVYIEEFSPELYEEITPHVGYLYNEVCSNPGSIPDVECLTDYFDSIAQKDKINVLTYPSYKKEYGQSDTDKKDDLHYNQEEDDFDLKEQMNNFISEHLYEAIRGHCDPSIRELRHKSKEYNIAGKDLLKLLEYCEILKRDIHSDHIPPCILGLDRSPSGSLKTFAEKTLSVKQNISDTLVRKRPAIVLNLFLIALIEKQFNLLPRLLFYYKTKENEWVPQSYKYLLKEKNLNLLRQIKNFSVLLPDASDEFLYYGMAHLDKLANASHKTNHHHKINENFLDAKSVIELFIHAYSPLCFASSIRTKKVIDKLDSYHINSPNGGKIFLVNNYLASRTLQRAKMLTNKHDWTEEWVAMLGELFESKSNDSYRFNVYQASYFKNVIDKETLYSFKNPQSCSFIYQPEYVKNLFNETAQNTLEERYSNNPHNRAINLLRLSIFVNLCERESLKTMAGGCRINAFNAIKHAWMKPLAEGKIKTKKIAGISVHEIIKSTYSILNSPN